ncbi:MAG TPA: ribosome rescue GTPase HflX [Cellvibrionaceae bacterium]
MFFDRPASGELAVLVHIDFNRDDEPNDPREFEELALSAGGDPVAFITGTRDVPSAKFFVGTGKLAEIKAQVQEHGAQLVVFNHSLSPSQERNLERELNCRVIDRTGLILDIFAQRARTHEGKLQVELAQLHHMSTRLVRGWTHLERQGGGIGLRGPGETQLETDRRLLRGRITMLEKRLEKVRKQREQGRRSRMRADIPTVSLVGYTNAGKSTLFNSITKAGVYAENQLFATLDPTMRRVEIPGLGKVILADTVGFMSHLPHKLVDAFRATLEEAASADLLLHVIDAADPERNRNIEQVEKVLEEIHAFDIPRLNLYNKIDLLQELDPRVDVDEAEAPLAVWLSAQAGTGIDLLTQAIAQKLGRQMCKGSVLLSPSQGSLRAKLHSAQAVEDEGFNEDGSIRLSLCLPQLDLNRILAAELLTPEQLEWIPTQP